MQLLSQLKNCIGFWANAFSTMQISRSMEPSSSCSAEHVTCAYATVEPTQELYLVSAKFAYLTMYKSLP
jgi:hypothetical protein